MKKAVKIAIVQSSAVHLNLEKSLELVGQYMKEASQEGAELIVFGETWLSGYPAWLDYCPEVALWDHEPTKEVFAKMIQNSVEVPGPASDYLCDLAAKHKLTMVIGINERSTQGASNGTLFNAFLIIDQDGKILNHHRKLMPTYTEKLVHGLGDGHGLQAVETPFGRLGALICWEHWMPMTRQAMHLSDEHIHIALWPKVHEMHQVACRHYAFEGRCFVIGVGQMMAAQDFPKELKLPDDLKKNPEKWVLDGGSCIVGPNGKYILKPQHNKEGLIIQEIKGLDSIYKEKMSLDVTGHYNRPDVFELNINKQRQI